MINPLVLLFGTGGFLASFIAHILIWRMIRPAKQLAYLAAIFIILPLAVYIAIFHFSSLAAEYRNRFIVQPFNFIFIILWDYILSAAYIISYPAIHALSPSLKIISAVSDSMPEGMTAESIADIFRADVLLSEPFNQLVNDGLISLKNGKWVISAKGRLLRAFFSVYRRVLGLPLGEG